MTVRHFLSQADLSTDEILALFEQTSALKPARARTDLAGRTLVMFFEKTSTRTRLSFEIGATQLGGHAVYLDRDSSQLSRGESVADTARVVSRYADIMMARVYADATIRELAANATIPVINGLSDAEHPCQSMADLFTIWERKGSLRGVSVAYLGDGNNNVTHSLMLGCALVGAHLRVAAPPELRPDVRFQTLADALCATNGGSVRLTESSAEAVRDADVVYTDVWVSMGRESERAARTDLLSAYQVNEPLMALAAPDALFMHCLPAHIGEEVTAGVAYGQQSVIFDQAENRLHVQKAIMLALLEWSGGERA